MIARLTFTYLPKLTAPVSGLLLLLCLRRAALRCGALVRGAALTPVVVAIASSNMMRAFALSSAASSARKAPESERCTICRSGWVERKHTRGVGGIVLKASV